MSRPHGSSGRTASRPHGFAAGGAPCQTAGAMGKREKRPPPAAAPGPFNPAFAGLAGRLGVPAPTPGAPLPARPAASEPSQELPVKPGPARAVVRMERSGRGGKVVTVVEKLGLPARELERWLGDLKRSLGCGGVVEGDALVLQGDSRDRVGAWLTARGVRRVTLA